MATLTLTAPRVCSHACKSGVTIPKARQNPKVLLSDLPVVKQATADWSTDSQHEALKGTQTLSLSDTFT